MLDLDELPAQLLLDPRHRLGGLGCTGHDVPDLVATGDLTLPVGCGFQDGGDHGRGGAHHGDSVRLDAAQALGTVDLADHNLRNTQDGHTALHNPTVGLYPRQGVQIAVVVGTAGLKTEGDMFDPPILFWY